MVDLKPGFLGGPVIPSAREYDLAIAGGGPAALAAALYAGRYMMRHVVLESFQPGGQAALTALVENYPGIISIEGGELAAVMRKQAENSGSEIRTASVTACSSSGDVLEIETDSGNLTTKTLIIATGAAPKKLGVPGEEEFYGRGVSYCATCDAPFFRDRKVLVVGGGDSAVKEALHLVEYASSVTVVHRRDELRAEPILTNKLISNEKCTIEWKSTLKEIRGSDFVESVLLDTPSGERELLVDGVFLYVGRKPATDPFSGVVELNADGTLKMNRIVHTSAPNVFGAGDVTDNSLRQVVTAASDGARAAAAAYEFLQTRER
jgi:thioredoxin reductase (NADPH)